MKIAVTFENGEVFQHFGHAEHIKLYEVEAGQTIGKVGATALFESEDPSHLHFEVHKEDKKVDPAQVLGAR